MDDQTNGVFDRLARIEVKIDNLTRQRDKDDIRLTRVERFMWFAAGMALASGAANVAAVLSS